MIPNAFHMPKQLCSLLARWQPCNCANRFALLAKSTDSYGASEVAPSKVTAFQRIDVKHDGSDTTATVFMMI